MAWIGRVAAVALLALGGCVDRSVSPDAASATAPEGGHVTLTHEANGEWIAEYRFTRAAPAWFFERSNPDGDGVPWRARSFEVLTPGVRLERIGSYDVLIGDGQPLDRVRIRVTPFDSHLRADYAPVLGFSDGGIAWFTGHFTVAPLASREAAAALPDDLNGYELEEPELRFTLVDPGRRLLADGRTLRGSATVSLGAPPAYLYSGDLPLLETKHFAGVLDPALPEWMRTELVTFTPRLFALYADRLGEHAGGRPTALVAWGGAEMPGYSYSGSVLDTQVVMKIAGKEASVPSPGGIDKVRWFFGHETAHFWLGHTIRYSRSSESWITEGAADLLAIRALGELVPGYDPRGELQREMTDCIALNGPGQPLSTAIRRNAARAVYACGALLTLAAEAVEKRRSRNGSVFTFARALIDANRADSEVTADEWIATFVARGGDAAFAPRIAELLDRGVDDPVAFWRDLFTASGVAFTERDGKLVLTS